ncbi:MAG: hypothetical protein ABIO67_12515, partial [Mycobacteriales bacterium]
MRPRPLATAVAAAMLIGGVAGPAAAASAATPVPAPAAGTATSALSLLDLALAGHAVSVGGVALTSDTVNKAIAKVVVTPIKVDGTAYGEQTVTPANSPASVPTLSTSGTIPAALSALASAQSPVFDVSTSTDNGAASTAGAPSLGKVSVLGLPIALDGTVGVSSIVNGTSALSQKEVTVSNLALPSIADLLAALGLDLKALPVSTLVTLLKELNLIDPAVTTAQQALDAASKAIQTQIDAAQKAVDDAAAALAAKTTELTGKQSQLAAAEADLAAKTAALAPLKAAVTTATANATAANATLTQANAGLAALPLTVLVLGVPVANPALAAAQAAVATAQAAASAATATLTQATADLAAAQSLVDVAAAAVTVLKSAVAALQAAIDALQKTLNDLIAILKGILAAVAPQLNALLAAVTAVLDRTPLVSIDSISIRTVAEATSASKGGQEATIVGGEVVGLKVLGTDVLNNVLGTTKIDLLDLVGGTLTTVNNLIGSLTGTLSSVLSNVPSFPALSVPAPKIGLLTKATSTNITDGFGVAQNSVKALSITIPAITLPLGLALPTAASLPALSGVPVVGALVPAALGDLVSKPISLSLFTLTEQSKFRPAVVAAPAAGGSGTPQALP